MGKGDDDKDKKEGRELLKGTLKEAFDEWYDERKRKADEPPKKDGGKDGEEKPGFFKRLFSGFDIETDW